LHCPRVLAFERPIVITLSYAVPHLEPFGFEISDWKEDIFMFALVGYNCHDPANLVEWKNGLLPSATPGSQTYPVALS
jgi:hypothetical protein